jgi:single-strand DNA-binding protein
MANFNKVILIGNLTRDPESRTFSNGGKVTKFGFAVNNRKKNSQTGQWEDEPMFIDCEAFNRGEFGKLADTIETYCKKGSQICIEGRLQLDQWDDKTTGQKRSKHKVVVETMQLLGTRQDGQGGGAPRAAGAPAPARAAAGGGGGRGPEDFQDEPPTSSGEDIPF